MVREVEKEEEKREQKERDVGKGKNKTDIGLSRVLIVQTFLFVLFIWQFYICRKMEHTHSNTKI